MMGIVVPETCWTYKKYNKILSGIHLVLILQLRWIFRKWDVGVWTNVTAPHGRPDLRSRLHSCHAQEGGPRSPQGRVVALDQKKYVTVIVRNILFPYTRVP